MALQSSPDLREGSENLYPTIDWFLVGASGKEPPADAGDIRDVGSIPRSGRSPGGENGNPLQHSCPENLMDRGT